MLHSGFICAELAARDQRSERVLFVSFLKEGAGQVAVLVALIPGCPPGFGCARVRRRCPGSAGGEPRSGRGPGIRRRVAHACSGGRGLLFVGLSVNLAGVWASAPSPVPRLRDRLVVAYRSFLRRARRHGVVRQMRPGGANQVGATRPMVLGVRHNTTRTRPRAGRFMPPWPSWLTGPLRESG